MPLFTQPPNAKGCRAWQEKLNDAAMEEFHMSVKIYCLILSYDGYLFHQKIYDENIFSAHHVLALGNVFVMLVIFCLRQIILVSYG